LVKSINNLFIYSLLVLCFLMGAGFVLRFGGKGYASLSNILICIGFSGLVGQLTNKLAVRMILDYVHIQLGFTQIRVPGSGLLQRNLTQLIDFVSEGSVEILNKAVVIKELREQAVLEKLLSAMREQSNTAEVKSKVISVTLKALESAMENDQFYFLLRDSIIKKYAQKHRALAIANAAGVIDYSDLTYKIIDGLKDSAHQLQSSPEAKNQLGAMAQVVWENLSSNTEKLEEQLSAMVGMALNRFDLAAAVRNRLAQFSPLEIKQKVEEGAADYLGWIEIWGGVLGAMVGLLMGTIL
jgi:uncharacterized membrane protein YheB (UPF0754 family)